MKKKIIIIGAGPAGLAAATDLIKYKDLQRDNLESKIEEKAIEVKYSLERNLNMLGTIATISPLLGLLGTVVGMITATNTSSGTGLKLIDSSNKQFAAGGGGGGSPFSGSLTNHDFRIQVGGTQNAIFKYAAGATGNLELGPSSGIGITFNGSTGNAGYAGIITATKFVGDGSGLTGVTASGSGVVIKHDGSTVGTAGTINFSTNLDVSAISAGIVTVTASGGGGGVSLSGSTNNTVATVTGANALIGEANLTFDGSTLGIAAGSSDNKIQIDGTNPYIQFREGTTNKAYIQWSGGSGYLQLGNEEAGEVLRLADGESGLVWRVGTSNRTVWTSGNDGASSGLDADLLDGQQGSYYSPNVGISTNLSGSFTASAGSPSTINTFGYGSGDIVVEYTVFIKNGSNYQSQKLLAMRDGTTVHSTQFAIMYSSSLLVQLDATISSGNILLRATPETGVSGDTTYKIKREVM